VRDANGNVVGQVGADGVVRDVSGKPIGKTSYIAPGSAVYGTDGKLLGTVGPDGRLIPAVLGPGGTGDGERAVSADQQVADKQQAIMREQRARQMAIQLESAMSGQMSQLVSAWGPPTQQMVVGAQQLADGGPGGMNSTAGGAAALQKNILIKAGTIMFAMLDTSVNSDEPGPVMATITDGVLKGGKLIGTMSAQGQKAMLTFNTLSLPTVNASVSINTVAIDPATARTALSSDTDNHYLLRYGTLFASTFLSGYAQALTQSGSTTSVTLSGIVHTVPPLDAQQKVLVALGNVGQQYSSVLGGMVNTPPTIKVYSGTSMGILFLADMPAPQGFAVPDANT